MERKKRKRGREEREKRRIKKRRIKKERKRHKQESENNTLEGERYTESWIMPLSDGVYELLLR